MTATQEKSLIALNFFLCENKDVPHPKQNTEGIQLRPPQGTQAQLTALAARTGHRSGNALGCDLLQAGVAMLLDANDPPAIAHQIIHARERMREADQPATIEPAPAAAISQSDPFTILAAQQQQLTALTQAVIALAEGTKKNPQPVARTARSSSKQ
jgi:hypothetical protein